MTTKTRYRQRSISVSDILWRKVKAEAARQGESVSAILRQLIRRGLK